MNIQEIYKLRDSFSIIGLTGKTGSGCTLFSEIISKPIKLENNEMLRTPSDIELKKGFPSNNVVFKRKYKICYEYITKHYKKYETISYISTLLFYSLHYFIHEKGIYDKDELINSLDNLIKVNYKKSVSGRDSEYSDVMIKKEQLISICTDLEILIQKIKAIDKDFNSIKDSEHLDAIYDAFWSDEFVQFASEFYKMLGRSDYYLGSFFVHRLGNKIRATGNPSIEDADLKKCAETKYIYSIAILINKLIKAWKSKNKECHICIDSLRNSLEIMFFKERYSAFYMVAIHNAERHEKRIKDRISELMKEEDNSVNINDVAVITSKVIELDNIENEIDDFKDGHFFAPDVENCIQKSEIHINNPGDDVKKFEPQIRDFDFYTMIEQWIKIQSLISHPGLITPSHEERCMQIAYNNKFNSGCISRQVGAVITDEYNSIRSVGWNDVPKGSVPCNLRSLRDIVEPEKIEELDKSYSVFETSKTDKNYAEGGNFSLKTREIFKELIPITEGIGLTHSFCFKSLHNKYENKENQVHTRSLHAEENAMLQVSKFGGQPLKNGTLYTTASPCELCAKKAYQLGMRHIVYIDPYPGISMKHILDNGYNKPNLKLFTGVIGKAYNKLFEPFMSFKDELSLIHKKSSCESNGEKEKSSTQLLVEKLLGRLDKGELTEIQFKEELIKLTN